MCQATPARGGAIACGRSRRRLSPPGRHLRTPHACCSSHVATVPHVTGRVQVDGGVGCGVEPGQQLSGAAPCSGAGCAQPHPCRGPAVSTWSAVVTRPSLSGAVVEDIVSANTVEVPVGVGSPPAEEVMGGDVVSAPIVPLTGTAVSSTAADALSSASRKAVPAAVGFDGSRDRPVRRRSSHPGSPQLSKWAQRSKLMPPPWAMMPDRWQRAVRPGHRHRSSRCCQAVWRKRPSPAAGGYADACKASTPPSPEGRCPR